MSLNFILLKILLIISIYSIVLVIGLPVRTRGASRHRYHRTARSDPYPKPLRALHNPHLFSGDIVKYTNFNNRNAVSQSYYLWPNAEIPYVIDPSLNDQKQLILNSMNHFHQFTCIKFRERNSNDKDYVRIFKGYGCYSTIGRDEDNPEMLSLGDGCYFPGTVVHELMHSVGFYHEQNRSDRDDFLYIYWDNIDDSYKSEFKKLNPSDNKILTPFDYNSIMLYGPRSYSKDGQSITMQPKKPGFTMIEVYDKPGLTKVDAEAINLLYKC